MRRKIALCLIILPLCPIVLFFAAGWGLAAMTNRSVRLYGRVVDQYGQPVPGVQVSGTVRHSVFETPVLFGSSSTEDQLIDAETDQDGRFCLRGARGIELNDITLSKRGYDEYRYNNTGGYRFGLGGGRKHDPDANRPVEFLMWKEDGKERLLSRQIEFTAKPKSGLYAIDLMQWSIPRFASGMEDLRIGVERASQVDPNRPYDWSLKIASVESLLFVEGDEGLQQHASSGYFNAPRELIKDVVRREVAARKRYGQYFEYAFKASDEKWTGHYQGKFSIRTYNDELFATIEVTCDASGGPDHVPQITLKYTADPRYCLKRTRYSR